MADIKDSYTLEALLTGDNSRLKKVVDQAVVMLERLEKRKADDIKIDADVAPLERKVETAQKLSEALDGKKAQIEIIARNAEAIKNLQKVRLSAKQLSQEKPKVHVEVETAAAQANVSRFKAILKSISNKLKVHADADTAGATSKIVAFRALIGKKLDKIDLKIDADTSSLGTVSRIFAQIGTAAGNASKEVGTLPALIGAIAPAAIPIAASLVPAIMAAGNAIAVLGGGAIGLAGAFGIAGAGALGFGAMAATAIKMYNDGLIQSSAATQGFQTSVSLLKSTWQGIVSMNADSIFGAMAKGATAATTALTSLTPFLSKSAGLIDQTAMKLVTWVRSSDTAKAAFSMLNTTGVSVFGDILAAAGSFGDGIVNIFTQFAPLFQFMSQGLQNMAADFQKWANSTSTANGIKDFISYVQTNLPVIGSIFSNVFTGIFNLFTAFGSNSQTIFGALEGLSAKFAAWSETVGQSQGFKQFIDYVQTQGPVIMSTIGDIVNAIINFATAMAPVGAAVLGVVSSIAQWVAGFTQAHPVITMVVGAVMSFIGIALKIAGVISTVVGLFGGWTAVMSGIGAVFTFLTGPITLTIAAIVAIGIAIVQAYKHFEGFRNVVNMVGQAIVQLAQAWMNGVSMIGEIIMQLIAAWLNGASMIISNVVSFGAQLLSLMGAAWNGLVSIVQTVWTFISAAVTIGIAFIVAGITSFGALLLSIFTAAWNGIVTVVTTVWTAISTAVTTGIQFVLTGLQTFGTMILTVFQTAWTGLTTVVSTAWTLISTAVMTGIQLVLAGIQVFGSNVVAIFTAAWNGLVTIVTTVWTAVSSAISSAISTIISVVSSGFSSVVSTVSSVMSSIISAVSSAWSSVQSAVSGAISAVVSAVSAGFSNMLSVASSIMSSISSAISSAWSAIISVISSAISSAVSAVTSGFSSMISAVSSFASSLISSISSAMSSFISAVTSGASNAVSALTSGLSNMISAAAGFVGEMMSAGRNLIMGMVNGITSAAGNLVSAAVGAVKGAISAAKSALGIHSPSRVFKKIGDFTMQGFVIGIMKGVPKVMSASKKMASAAFKGLGKMKTNSYQKAKEGSKTFYTALSTASKNAAKKIASNNSKMADIQKRLKGKLTNATRAGLLQRLAAYTKENVAYKLQRKTIDGLKTSLRKSTNELKSIAKKRESIADRLKKAQDKLKSIRNDKADFKKSILDDTRGFGSVASSEATTSQGLIADMKARAKAVSDYAKNINALKAKGVNKDIIKDLLNAGIEGGSQQASILANASKTTIDEINALQTKINGVSQRLANKQGNEFFNVGINTAKGIVQGLKAQDKELVAAATHIANTITKTVKKNLGIHSPSRVFAKLGVFTMQGFTGGAIQAGKSTIGVMAGLADKVTNAFTPTFASGLPDISSNLRDATSSIATQVNADVVNTVRNEPVGVAFNANLSLGNRDYNAFVEDITDNQNSNIRLQEVYGI